MNNFKCAVLLSGESRTWELAKNNIKSFFERGVKCEFNNIHRPFKVDYFIHTWDTNSWRDPTQPHGTKDSFKLEVIPSNTKQKMEDFYNPKFIEINSNIDTQKLYELIAEYPVIKPTGLHSGKGVKIYGIDFTDSRDAVDYITHYLKQKYPRYDQLWVN